MAIETIDFQQAARDHLWLDFARMGGYRGRPLRRREDVDLLQGRARYLDDIELPGMGHLAFVRSPLAHARLGEIDVGAALRAPGVVAVVTAADIEGRLRGLPIEPVEDAVLADAPHPVLARERVRYAGEPVAAVVAASRAEAEDAAELVQVEYEPLPVLVDQREALAAGVLLHERVMGNLLVHWTHSGGDVAAAFADCGVRVRASFHIPRLVAVPIETRGAIASFDPDADLLTVWCSAQDPHRPLADLSYVLGRPEERIRLVVPVVGGAFGSKGALAPEAALAAWLAIELGRPVKWSEDRLESFLAAYQGRGLDADVEFAAASDGRILAVRARLFADLGAYLARDAAIVPHTTAKLLTGVYAIPAAEVELLGAATNKVPTGPYRGAGRPEAAFIVERMVDLIARDLGLDPVEIRRRNFIPREAFPYRTPLGWVYDSGDYERCLDLAVEQLEVDSWREERQRSGRVLGIGVAMLIERCGGLWESAAAQVDEQGCVVVRTGSCPHGQGHETTFAQIAADELGIEPEDVRVVYGDSALVPPGVGTFASRSVAVGGSAVVVTLREIRERCRRIAAHLLGVTEDEVVWDGRRFVVPGAEGRGLSFREVAAAAARADRLPAGLDAGLSAEGAFTCELLFSTGAYGAVVEIDPRTGVLRVLRLVAVDDAGRIVNPLLAEGQVIGATVQGLGQALVEEALVDEQGQPLAVNLADYTLLTAAEVPPIMSEFVETPSPFNPLGAKGIGEGGSIGTPAAIGNAVADALASFGVRHVDLPFTEEKLWRLVQSGELAGAE